MKTEKQIQEQLRTLNKWIDQLDYDKDKSTIEHLAAYYDVLQWVVNDKDRWVEDYGLSHVLEEAKKC